MKKTSLILIMLMFVMSTNIFAQANRARTGAARKTTTVKKTTPARATTLAKPIEIKPVDMGLSVKWASSPLGTTAANKPGKFITRSEAEKKCKELGEGWRLPTQKEVMELIDNSYIEFILTNGKPVGVRCWSKKNHAALTFYFGECAFYGNGQKNFLNPTIKDGKVCYIYYLPSEQGGCILIEQKQTEQIKKEVRNHIGNALDKLGKNYGEWPDEAKKDLETVMKYKLGGEYAGVSVDFSYFGIKQECNYEVLWPDAAKLIFTPVFDVNDDDDTLDEVKDATHGTSNAEDNSDVGKVHKDKQEIAAVPEHSQQEHAETAEDKIYDVVEQSPSFPGGDGAMAAYISSHIKYPEYAEKNGIQGRVIVGVVVTKTGNIKHAKVLKGVDPSLDEEAIRVVSNMPTWIPGKQNGYPVAVNHRIPVTFRLQ